jgi:thiamine biosynthesis protein ThiI
MKGVLLMSDGIDSPVAGYLLGRQGVDLVALHFDSSEASSCEATGKILALRERLEEAVDANVSAFSVPHRKTLLTLSEDCRRNLTCVLCRRMMFRIGALMSEREDAAFMITGESLGQVASQTLTNIFVEEQASTVPVIRPLIGMDKVEIVNIAKNIGTYELSISSGPVCSFAPERPSTNSALEEVLAEEERVDATALAAAAFDSAKRLE